MKKVLLFVFVLILGTAGIFLCSCGTSSASPAEDFNYEFVDGNVTITGYIGSDINIIIPKEIENRPVTKIDSDAFKEYDMVSIVIPDTITNIEQSAFSNCNKLSEITLSKNLETIGRLCFFSCDSLKKIEIPNAVIDLGSETFKYCENLEEVTMSQELFDANKDRFNCEPTFGTVTDFTSINTEYGIFYKCTKVKINGISINEFS